MFCTTFSNQETTKVRSEQTSGLAESQTTTEEEFPDVVLTSLTDQVSMEKVGWVFNVGVSMLGSAHECGTDTWYGYTGGPPIGYVQVTLKEYGKGMLNYGNCHSGGVFAQGARN